MTDDSLPLVLCIFPTPDTRNLKPTFLTQVFLLKKGQELMLPSFTYNLAPSIKFGCGLAAMVGEELVSRYEVNTVYGGDN